MISECPLLFYSISCNIQLPAACKIFQILVPWKTGVIRANPTFCIAAWAILRFHPECASAKIMVKVLVILNFSLFQFKAVCFALWAEIEGKHYMIPVFVYKLLLVKVYFCLWINYLAL